MSLSKTNGNNWAKEISITAGSKWRFVGNFATEQEAEAAAAIQAAKGRKTSVTAQETSKSGSKKCYERALAKLANELTAKGVHGDELKSRLAQLRPLPVGTVYFRVEAYIEHRRQVMTHASAAECTAAGKTPGRCNL